MGKLDGHCMCGAITFTGDADPIMVAICHCTDCQRQSGAPFSVNVAVNLEDLVVTGTPKVHETMGEERGEPARRNFCGDCGSPIMSILADADDIAFLKAGTLADASWLEPEMEVWTDSAQPWMAGPERDDRGYFPRGLNTD